MKTQGREIPVTITTTQKRFKCVICEDEDEFFSEEPLCPESKIVEPDGPKKGEKGYCAQFWTTSIADLIREYVSVTITKR